MQLLQDRILRRVLDGLRRTESGASAVEYGLLVAGIAGLIVLMTFAFGDQINALFADTCDSIQNQRGAGAC